MLLGKWVDFNQYHIVLYRVRNHPYMTYNVSSGSLNPTIIIVPPGNLNFCIIDR